MRYTWTIRNKAENLIIFFNGWGLDEQPFIPLTSSLFDVLMFYDYQTALIPPQARAMLQPYKSFTLIGFSMGVWMSQKVMEQLPDTPVFSLAINGTLNPIHDRYGIPPAIYDQQCESFSEAAARQFYEDLVATPSERERFLAHLPRRGWQDQQAELIRLRELVQQDPLDRLSGQFDAAYISTQDKIISARNQMRFWKNQSTVHMLESGHFPFYRWPSWEALLHEVQGE